MTIALLKHVVCGTSGWAALLCSGVWIWSGSLSAGQIAPPAPATQLELMKLLGSKVSIPKLNCGPQNFGPISERADRSAIRPEIEIEQEKLRIGFYSFRQILEAGRHLFTVPFSDADGHGEGGALDEKGQPVKDKDDKLRAGPRQADYQENVHDLAIRLLEVANPSYTPTDLGKFETGLRTTLQRNIPATGSRTKPPGVGVEPGQHLDLLRLNGLDSQSCFECHDTIGVSHLNDTRSAALARRVAGTGGPAGLAANLYNNGRLRQPKPSSKTPLELHAGNWFEPENQPDPQHPVVESPGFLTTSLSLRVILHISLVLATCRNWPRR